MRHVVLITIDALRRDVLGTYGNPNALTPFLDSLAADGLVFTGAYLIFSHFWTVRFVRRFMKKAPEGTGSQGKPQ